LHRVVLALGSLGLVAFYAQPARAADGDITAGYSYMYDSDSSTGFPAGWFFSAGANITDAFAVVGDVSGHYKSQSASSGGVTVSASTNIYTFLAGPRVVGRSGPSGSMGSSSSVPRGQPEGSPRILAARPFRQHFGHRFCCTRPEPPELGSAQRGSSS
jgi:hypothetical protein